MVAGLLARWTLLEIVCPALVTPSNAVNSNCHGQINESVGIVCQFSCVHAFQPSAPQPRKCLANGTWSGRTLFCSAVSCPPLAQPKFGSVQLSQCLNGGKYNDICNFACQNTFRMKETGTRTCTMNGQWTGSNDTYCEEEIPPDIEVSLTLSYLTKNCDEQDPTEVQTKFFIIVQTAMQTKIMSEYCKLTGCKPENIYVRCGKKDDGRRKRSAQFTNRLEIDFQMKIPFPKNQSSTISNTIQNVQTSVVHTINESASTIEIRGVKLKLESPPNLKFIGLKCKDGYVLNSASCAACPPGYYYESASKSCSICPVNHYQKEEAQMSCLACPFGTSTLNSKGSKTCEKDEKAATNTGGNANTFVVPVAVTVAVLVVVVGAIVAAFFVVRRCRHPRQAVSRTDSHRVPMTTYGPPRRTEFTNPAYGELDNDNYNSPSGVNHVTQHYDYPSGATHVTNNYDVPCAAQSADENAWEGRQHTYYNMAFGSHLQVNNPTYDDTVPSRQDNYKDHIYESIRQQRPVGHPPASTLFENDTESQRFQMTNRGFQVDADCVNPSEVKSSFKGESIA